MPKNESKNVVWDDNQYAWRRVHNIYISLHES